MQHNDYDPFRFPRLAMLFSYAYMRSVGTGWSRSRDILRKVVPALAPYMDVMIDSGAFTNQGEVLKANLQGKEGYRISVEEYIDACQEWKDVAWAYVQLDEIGDPKATRKNLDRMVAAGLRPMPVYTRGEDMIELLDMIEVNPRVCFGGMVGSKGAYAPYIMAQAYEITDGKILSHALGWNHLPEALQLPIASNDSSSYCQGGRFGVVMSFDREKGFIMDGWDNLHKDKARARKLVGLLRSYNISLAALENKLSYNKVTGIPSMTTSHAYLRYQAFARTQGLVYFLASPNTPWINPLLAIIKYMTRNAFDYPSAVMEKEALDEVLWRDVDEYIERAIGILKEHTEYEAA